jgi:RND family efflux transporter MFP subunit
MDDAQLVATMAQFAQLKASYERSRSLYESSAIPKAQFELVEGPYLAMKRQMENLEENTTLKAPFPGVVTARAVEEGELFSPGMTPGQPKGLVHITQLNPLKIDLDVDNQTVLQVKKGMKVRFTVDNMPESAGLEGKIEWVNPQANSQSRMFSVRVIIQNPDLQLRPGYFAEVHIVLAEKENALIVPREAIVDDRVFIVRDSMAFSNKPVLGWLTDYYAEILSGIEENDIVVLTGNKALPDSALVTVVE